MVVAPSLSKKDWTEAELQALPEDGCLHEIVNGELVMSPKNNPTTATFARNCPWR